MEASVLNELMNVHGLNYGNDSIDFVLKIVRVEDNGNQAVNYGQISSEIVNGEANISWFTRDSERDGCRLV